MIITHIERIGVNMQYDERVAEHLYKSSLANRATDEEFAAHNERFHTEQRERPMPSVTTTVYLVHSDDGLTGLGEGESMSNDALAMYVGHSPFEYIMDDSVGPLQIAFYDLMGQALGLPIARLLGPSRTTAPLAWWSHCFSPAALQVEAKLALARGFRVHKIKRRAHTDVVEQVAAIAEVTPDDYEVTVDANRTFGNVERALAIGAQLKRFPQVHCLESPIDQDDIEGYRRIKAELGLQLAHHIGQPDPIDALYSGVYDYFILGTRVAAMVRDAHITDARGKPFWMQSTSTDVTALFMLHLAAASPNATRAHVTTSLLHEQPLLQEPLIVTDGYVTIPERPGLGATLNMDMIERFRVE
jgi:L-alanine-DL-glutamate epimerase-like enolase superfamily enzyme